MTLFIQTDAGTSDGLGDVVFPAHASLDLLQISKQDLGDDVAAGYGEEDAGGNLVKVTYERSTSGPCPERLEALVNTRLGVEGDGIDIIVIAVGSGFTLADGTPLAGNGSCPAPGTEGNPTASVLVFYDVQDNHGDGMCLHAQDNGQYDLTLPTPVLLYHELSHALRRAKGELLSLSTVDPCSDASPEEQAAMHDENDMRAQLGERLRSTTNHCANTGIDGSCASSCCLVATVATGSPYSVEVGALRRIRDTLLRRSEVGFDFFSHLHDDYYGFSPEVCRLMADSRALQQRIRSHFVGPLTACLDLVVAYTLGGATTRELGQRALERLAETPALQRLTPDEWAAARAVLEGGPLGSLPGAAELGPLAAVLDERARGSAFVRWALLEPIRMLIDTRCMVGADATPEAIGEHLARSFDAWAVQLPLTDVWHGLSRYAIAEELELLGRALVRTRATRARLGARIVAHLHDRADVAQLVDTAWGTAGAAS